MVLRKDRSTVPSLKEVVKKAWKKDEKGSRRGLGVNCRRRR